MAPEQAAGAAVDARSDLFSLGCVLYRLAAGELPFQGANAVATLVAVAAQDPRPPRELRPDLPPALAELVLRLLAKKPEARFPSALAVVQAIQAVEQSPLRRRPARSRPWLRIVLAAAVVLLLRALGVACLLRFRSRPTPDATAATPPPSTIRQAPAPEPPAPPEPPPLNDQWQVVAEMSSPRYAPGMLTRDFRAAAFHLPYVYAVNAKSFTTGDLVVFKLPEKAPILAPPC